MHRLKVKLPRNARPFAVAHKLRNHINVMPVDVAFNELKDPTGCINFS